MITLGEYKKISKISHKESVKLWYLYRRTIIEKSFNSKPALVGIMRNPSAYKNMVKNSEWRGHKIENNTWIYSDTNQKLT